MGLFTKAAVAALISLGVAQAQPTVVSKLKDEQRMPWRRGGDRFLRQWLVVGAFPGGLDQDVLGGEGGIQPSEGQEVKRSDGSIAKWHTVNSWADMVGLEDLEGPKEGVVAYAFTKITRASAGKALLSLGSDEGIRVWVNGKLVLSRDGLRSAVPDEDQIQVDLKAGENNLLIKVPQQMGAWNFCARVLEPGTVLPRNAEINPSILKYGVDGFTLKTDTGERADAEAVKIELVASGGKVLLTKTAPRGVSLPIEAREVPEGPYEIRCSTHTPEGRLTTTHLSWYKGECLAKARELAATAAKADAAQPEGFTLKMLAEMVEDRLGCKLGDAKGNPWWKIHAPLMEYDEMMLERKGQTGRIRASGFVRLAYRDEVDGTPQYCRAYLPPGYDTAKKWPLVLQMHGYNPANPIYVRWWGADSRHAAADTEYANHQGVIYMEPHGRGNTSYRGMGDSDIVRVIAEAKRLFNVDEDRVYLTGDSMGGWGTWNVSTRHPDLFAAIAPVFGGADYHVDMSEEQLAKLSPLDRFLNEKESSWSMAESLLNIPIFIHHGDVDKSVKVDYSRWATRLLQRWGYDVRYREYPGRAHEALEVQNGNLNIDWFLEHRRDPNPRHVRIRSAELRNAKAYWAQVQQMADPLDFMVVDAEVVGSNLIRVDTQNVLELTLSPSAALVDAQKPLKVVWNGGTREARLQQGKVTLSAEGSVPAALRKSPRLPGSMADFLVTPFAIVVGTTAKDAELREICDQKAKSYQGYWRDWQKQELRLFKDTEISDADLAKYSLLLIGGPEANRVTAKLAAKLPLKISPEQISIDGKTFPVKDAAVQMLYPSPLNPERYVLVIAGTSTEGMFFSNPLDREMEPWDYVILDGHIPAFRQQAQPRQTRVDSGVFDKDWRFKDTLSHSGDSEIRAKGRLLRRPKLGLLLDPKVTEGFLGRYQIEQGPLVEVIRDGKRLMAKISSGGVFELVPESETDFYIREANVRVSFLREGGQVTRFLGYQSGNDFLGKKLP